MDAEVPAEYGERSPERVQRVSVPGVGYPCRDDGSAHPEAQRRELLPEFTASQRGGSSRPTWKVYPQGGWTIFLGCEGISKSQVSRICQELDVVVDGFMGRPLDAGPYPYLWLDALTQKVREAGRIVNVSVVVATAVNGQSGNHWDGRGYQ